MALICLLTAQPGKGKSQAALGLMGPKAVFFAPTPINANPKITAIPWAYVHDIGDKEMADIQKDHPRMRLILDVGEVGLLTRFMDDSWAGYTFVFDDYPQLFPFHSDGEKFGLFIVGIRHRQGRVIVTTQQIKGVMPRLARTVADEIIQVGPLVAEDEARLLYQMGGGATYRKFSQFYEAISTNPDYALFYVKKS